MSSCRRCRCRAAPPRWPGTRWRWRTALPPVVLTLLAGLARYHLHLAITPMVIPAIALTCLTGVLMGLAVAHGVAQPMAANLISVR